MNNKSLSILLLAMCIFSAKGKLVDWHCHNVMPDFVKALESHNAQMDENFPLPQWNVEAHLQFMDSADIETEYNPQSKFKSEYNP